MTNTQRDAMQQALDALEYAHATNKYESARQELAITALRKALAEPVMEPVSQIAEALRVHGMSLIKTADGYDIMRLGDIKAQSTSPPPPAEVPLLTDDQCRSDFEAFVNAELGDVAVTDQERYISPKIQNYWRVWQTAIQKAGIK